MTVKHRSCYRFMALSLATKAWFGSSMVETMNDLRLQFAAEGAVLEGGEECVQFCQGRALRGLELLHRRDSAGEFALDLNGGQCDWRSPHFGNAYGVQPGSCLSCTEQMPPANGRVEIFASIEWDNFR